ncbi:hypothetical protein DFQ01_101135 [Paenibacillus cellulosilyticus]|uniref:Uncharacterized protein n=1 Tax=Paenibacillus cellulosilyticus TaxID=375489 RepID=A0A2V2Z031_9BACL|nr:hypothetical protein [Paenibacillus cellulosilyticus]PWW08414.1 hypothetical protein DFQ01_101135 [Paenibacillus cellulosilyticus]QKS48002.1 hypothetical protein HUB94_27315 [Paenibacillus cellulosilyticus]
MNLSKTHIAVVTLVAIGMLLFDWRGLTDIRTKIAYFSLYIPGFTLAILLIIYPNLPGPVQWMRPLFAPLAKLLFKS